MDKYPNTLKGTRGHIETFTDYVSERHPDHAEDCYRGFYWDNLREACEGLASEAGELLQCQRKQNYERLYVSPGEFVMEASDILHYLALFCARSGVTLEELASVNYLKTQAADIGRRGDFELLMRAWNNRVTPLCDELQEIGSFVFRKGSESHEPVQ